MKKILKFIFSVSTVTVVAISMSATIVSCGHETKARSWDEFKRLAIAESASGIVEYATVKAIKWEGLGENDFTFVNNEKPVASDKFMQIVATIHSKTLNNTGIFTVRYTSDEEYKSSDWACTTQPGSDDFTFRVFKN